MYGSRRPIMDRVESESMDYSISVYGVLHMECSRYTPIALEDLIYPKFNNGGWGLANRPRDGLPSGVKEPWSCILYWVSCMR